MEVLRLENLSKFYTTDSSIAVGLTGINLSFSIGEFVALTGESGSGKSTMAHVLGGILPYESGELYVMGRPTSHYDAGDWANYRRDMISFISQSYGILPGNTVAENVESALRLSGLSKEEAVSRTDAILREVELTEFKKRKAAKLSSGQKQRLSIARALAKPSKILIADEPTGNLDRENSDKVIALLKKASKEKLVILITHEFEEAKDVATRRITLSDGEVVTDAELRKPDMAPMEAERVSQKKAPKKQFLAPYICRLSVISHPIFTGILCILLAATSFITFVFLGNFIIALDDTSTKIYNNQVFFNGDPNRLVVMRSDGELLTEEDYQTILSQKYTEKIDRFGRLNDLIYHYKEGVDHIYHNQIILGPNYHEVLNPDDYTIEPMLELYDKGYSYMQSFPLAEGATLVAGRKAESTYEVVSADPDFKVGDTVRVYIKDINGWSIGAYLTLDLLVVGETDYGTGLYVSDQLADALSSPKVITDHRYPYYPGNIKYIFLPFQKDMFPLQATADKNTVPGDNQYIFSQNRGSVKLSIGTPVGIQGAGGERLTLYCAELHNASYDELILVSDATFRTLTNSGATQASLYIEDYSYTARVIKAVNEEGYIAISPYQLGATEVDATLSRERLTTLGVCAATFLVALILQSILLFAMFASLNEYYKLMANTGLTANTARFAVSALLLLVTLIGEAFGAGSIFLLDAMKVKRVVDIFKYLDPSLGLILFGLHFALVGLSLLGIIRRMKRAVFGKNKAKYDIDFTEMEESAND